MDLAPTTDRTRQILRYLLTGAALFAFALAWNALLHRSVLAGVDASVQHLRRSDFADKFWLSLLLTAGIVALFVTGNAPFARRGSVREGALHGLFFACFAGLLVGLNQYILYPLPARVPALWFLGGVVEFIGDGVLTSPLCGRPANAAAIPPAPSPRQTFNHDY